MTLFVVFLVACFLGSIFLLRARPALRSRLLLGLCAAVAFAYYFLHRI